MLIGYARVSTDDQNLDLQKDALEKAGCEKIFEDHISGSRSDRPGLSQMTSTLREGDVVVVWRLDRLGRSLKDLIDLVGKFEESGISLKSLQESIDTSTSGGRFFFHIFGALAEFERNVIRERTQAGLIAARARGKKGGRKEALNESKKKVAIKLYHEREHTVDEICRMMGISKPTLYRYLRG